MMKRETKRRIAYYQDALPDMKKKVFAAALMLLIAVIISITATYAWITLSVAPVVSSVNTTMSANGTLEIALSAPEGIENPPKDQDIDETLTDDQRKNLTTLAVSNLQWGNLINLSDPSYALDKIVLRPARLNLAALRTDPLMGMIYGSDGRVSAPDPVYYTYMTWHEGIDGKEGEFRSPSQNGVRVIAAPEMLEVDVDQEIYLEANMLIAAATQANDRVNDLYLAVHDKVKSMSEMLSSFVQSKVPASFGGGEEKPFTSGQIDQFYNLYNTLLTAMEAQKDAFVALARLQSFVASNKAGSGHVYDKDINWEKIEANKGDYNTTSVSVPSKNGAISLAGLSEYITDLEKAKVDVAKLKLYADSATTVTPNTDSNKRVIYWSSGGDSGYNIVNIVDRLLDYNKMTIKIEGIDDPVSFQALSSSPTSYVSQLLGMDGDYTDAYINGGILLRFEQLAINSTARLPGPATKNEEKAHVSVSVTAKYGITMTVTIHGICQTTADDASYFETQREAARSSQMGTMASVGRDTYGMAVDFWLRTNAEETYLTLEGAMVEENGVLLSYGVNRVWGIIGDPNPTTNSTTQGGGSCYTFYADTEEDMERSKDLLDSMKVAFVNSDGTLLAQAFMDTENSKAISGRTVVPLAIESSTGVAYTDTDETGVTVEGRALAKMTYNDPMLITAIVYLNGDYLTNEQVLAANNIDGQLNIQFGSSADLDTRGDDDLLVAERVVTAELNKYTFDFLAAVDDAAKTVEVTVKIFGDEPDRVKASFIRAVSATQGERQKEMTFTKESDGTWTSSFVVPSSGDYYLRHVQLDGVEYALEDPPMLKAEGISVASVEMPGIAWSDQKTATTYAPESSYEAAIKVKLGTTKDIIVSNMKVTAAFFNEENNPIYVDLTADDSGFFVGTAKFSGSGTYRLSYVEIDGERYDVGERWGYELTLHLGLRVTVRNNGSTLQDIYEYVYDAETDMLVKPSYTKRVGATIENDAGDPLPLYHLDENGNTRFEEVTKTDSEGNEVTELVPVLQDWAKNVKIAYSQGGSAIGASEVDMTWNESEKWFTAEFTITSPGRYSFSYVNLDGSILSRATEAPTFTVMPKEPPTYIADSASTSPQFAAKTNNGYIGPLKIKNSAAAAVVVEVYNDVSRDSYLIPNDRALEHASEITDENFVLTDENGLLRYRATDNEDAWLIMPIYETSDGAETQEGTWSVKSIHVWDYMKQDASTCEFDDRDVWTDGSNGYDFSALDTTILCTVGVQMTPYSEPLTSTSLGGKDAAFMAHNRVEEIGMSIKLTDGSGVYTMPAEKIAKVQMVVNYAGNDDLSYGYKVNPNAVGGTDVDTISFVDPDGDGTYVVDPQQNFSWQYVGEYTVSEVRVTMVGAANDPIVFTPNGTNGIPNMYTVTSKAPQASDLTIGELMQSSLTLGMRGDNVTGTFLEKYKGTALGQIEAVLKYEDADGNTKNAAAVDVGVSVKLHLTHQGKNVDYGGYSWGSQTNALTDISLSMSDNGGTYIAGETPLLAGVYNVEAIVTVGDGAPETKQGQPISVYSMKPTVTMTAVSPGNDVEVTVNKDTTAPTLVANAVTFKARNAIVNDGKNAVVFASYSEYGDNQNPGVNGNDTSYTFSKNYANYEMPTIQFALENAGGVCQNFTLSIPNNTTHPEFIGNGVSRGIQIGSVKEGEAKHREDSGFASTKEFTYKTKTPVVIGSVEIEDIAATYDGVIYTVELTDKLSIVQENKELPSVIFAGKTYVTGNNESLIWDAFGEEVSKDGREFKVTLPTAAQYSVQSGHAVDPGDVVWVKDGSPTVGDKYAIYKGIEKYTYVGPSAQRTGNQSGCSKLWNGTCDCTATFSIEAYTENVQRWKAEAVTTTYPATFGLIGWNVGGTDMLFKDDPDGVLEVTVTIPNTVATPIIGEIAKNGAGVSKTSVGTAETTWFGKLSTTIDGEKVTGTSSNQNDEPTAKEVAKTNAESKAGADAVYKAAIEANGYASIEYESQLPHNRFADPGAGHFAEEPLWTVVSSN